MRNTARLLNNMLHAGKIDARIVNLSVDQQHALALRTATCSAMCLLTESGDESEYQPRSSVRADVQRAQLQVPVAYESLQSTDNSSLNDSHVGSSLHFFCLNCCCCIPGDFLWTSLPGGVPASCQRKICRAAEVRA